MERRGIGNNNFNSQMFGNNNYNQLTEDDLAKMSPEEREKLADIMGKMGNFTSPSDMEEWNKELFKFAGEYYQNQLKNGNKKSPNNSSGNINGSDSNDNSNSIAIIAGIAVVIIIAVIGAAIFIVKRNKRKQEEKYKILSGNNTQPQQTNPLPIIIQQPTIYTTTSDDNPPNYQPPAYSIEDGDTISNLGENTNTNINVNASINASSSVYSSTNENRNINSNTSTTNTPTIIANQVNTEISQDRASPVLSKEQLMQYVTAQQTTKSVIQPVQPVVQPMQSLQPIIVKKSVNKPLPKTMMVGNQLYVLADPNYNTTPTPTPAPATNGQVISSYSPSLTEKRPLYPPNYSYTVTESSNKLEAYASSPIQVPADATPVMVPHLTAVQASPVHGPIRVIHPLTPPLPAATSSSIQPKPVATSIVQTPTTSSTHSTVSLSNRNSQVRDRKN